MPSHIVADPAEVRARQWEGFGGEVGWDVGANVGQSVPHMLTLFQSVVALEPAAESFKTLAQTWEDDDRVMTFRVAASDVTGHVLLSEREGPIQTGQLVSVGMPYHGEDLGQNTAVWGRDLGTREVLSRTLDSLARELGFPDFVKVDTEGHEVRVLRGSGLLLGRLTDWLIEFHSAELYRECIEILVNAGYSDVETIRNPRYEKGSPMWFQHGWLRATASRSSKQDRR